jgi:hypothetical protein
MTTKLLLAGTLILEDSSGCTEINDRVIETRRWPLGARGAIGITELGKTAYPSEASNTATVLNGSCGAIAPAAMARPEWPLRVELSRSAAGIPTIGSRHISSVCQMEPFGRCRRQSRHVADMVKHTRLTQMYGAAVRCKRFDRSVGLRSCINVSGL